MTGSGECFDLETGGANDLAVLDRPNVRLRSRDDLAPELVHQIAIEARCAGNEARGIDEMGGSNGMHEDLRSPLCPPAGGAGMIEVDMGHEDMVDVGRLDAEPRQLLEEHWLTR